MSVPLGHIAEMKQTIAVSKVRQLEMDKEDLIRALSWLHDTAILHYLECENQTEFGNALDRAWEILEEMKKSD